MVMLSFAQLLFEIFPIAPEAIGITARRLWRLRLQPSDNTIRRITELMNTTDSRPGTITSREVIFLAIKPAIDLPFQDQIGFFQGMIMRTGYTSRFILHHKHGG